MKPRTAEGYDLYCKGRHCQDRSGRAADKDIYDLSPEEMRGVPSLPASLDEALRALENDHAFMTKGDVFTEEIIETWIDYKMTNEVDAIRLRPHPHEFAMYYDI